MRRWFSSAGAALPLALFAGLLAPTPAPAETCMSPFVKRLDRPEKYLYVFCVDADARDNDFLAVIDVDAESSRYGQILYQLDLGSAGNETHHFGYTDDRTHIWGCSLFSNRIFVINVVGRPRPAEAGQELRLLREDRLHGAAFALRPAGPHADQLPGRQGRRPAGGAGGVRQRRHIHPQARHALGSPLRLRRGHQPRQEPDGHVELHAAGKLPEAAGQDGYEALRRQAGGLGLPRPQAAADADHRGGAAGVPLVAQGGGRPRLRQLRPRRLALGLGGRRPGGLRRPEALRDGQAPRRPQPVAGRQVPVRRAASCPTRCSSGT